LRPERNLDLAARNEALDLLEEAIACGGYSSWFNRLRTPPEQASIGAQSREVTGMPNEYREALIAKFDELLEQLGTKGTRYQKWSDRTSALLNSSRHSEVQEGLERVGQTLGYAAVRPKHGAATDCRWRGIFGNSREVVTFEAKIQSQQASRISPSDVGQAHNHL
jgi:hypothetical protein